MPAATIRSLAPAYIAAYPALRRQEPRECPSALVSPLEEEEPLSVERLESRLQQAINQVVFGAFASGVDLARVR